MTIDISPEAVENLWRFWANKAQALADENKALSAALTASQAEPAAAYEAVKVKPLGLSNLLKHAFLSGVVAARNIPGWDECEGTELWVDYDPTNESSYERILAALTPADSKAALDRMIAEAEERGRNIGVATEKLGRLVEWLKEDEYNVFLIPADDVEKMRAILAAIPKGKDHE